jgi:hypothetical protein
MFDWFVCLEGAGARGERGSSFVHVSTVSLPDSVLHCTMDYHSVHHLVPNTLFFCMGCAPGRVSVGDAGRNPAGQAHHCICCLCVEGDGSQTSSRFRVEGQLLLLDSDQKCLCFV